MLGMVVGTRIAVISIHKTVPSRFLREEFHVSRTAVTSFLKHKKPSPTQNKPKRSPTETIHQKYIQQPTLDFQSPVNYLEWPHEMWI